MTQITAYKLLYTILFGSSFFVYNAVHNKGQDILDAKSAILNLFEKSQRTISKDLARTQTRTEVI